MLVSPSLDDIERNLNRFITKVLDDFESGQTTFKQSINLIRRVYDQPSIRLQLSSLCQTGTNMNSIDSQNSKDQFTSKHIIQRLCEWITIKQHHSDSPIEIFHNLEPGKICLAVQLIRLWNFTHRHINRMKSEGNRSLAQATDPHQGSSQSLRIIHQSELVSRQVAGHLEIITRITSDSIAQIVTTFKTEFMSTNDFTQSSIPLTTIILADLLCHLIFWILHLTQHGTITKDPILNLS